MRTVMLLTLSGLLVSTVPLPSFSDEIRYGTLTGKLVFDGEPPKPKYIIRDGKLVATGKPPKDVKVCAKNDLLDESLIVDPKHRGIGNVFVYIRNKPRHVHPERRKPPNKPVRIDVKQCRYVPHAQFIRTNQKVLLQDHDACSHNRHEYPLVNEGSSVILPPKSGEVPVQYESPEPLPMKVGCDIHPWMTAYWLILDHPYGAISVASVKKNEDAAVIGTFRIEKLPFGTYDFVVWHEKTGYIPFNSRRGFKVTIDKPVVKLKPFKVPAKTFSR